MANETMVNVLKSYIEKVSVSAEDAEPYARQAEVSRKRDKEGISCVTQLLECIVDANKEMQRLRKGLMEKIEKLGESGTQENWAEVILPEIIQVYNMKMSYEELKRFYDISVGRQ